MPTDKHQPLQRKQHPTLWRRSRRIWANLILIIIVAGICVSILEFGIRIVMPQPASWLAIYEQHPRLPFYKLQANANATVDTGETHWVVYTDENGFRIGATTDTDATLALALVLGDSFTFGHGVNYDESFVGLLAAAPNRRYRFINAGVGGYGPSQYLAVLEDALAQGMQPDFVLVATFLGNDFHDMLWSKSDPIVDGLLGNRGDLKSLIKRHSHFYRLAANLYHQLMDQQRKEATTNQEISDPQSWRSGLLSRAQPKYLTAMEHIATLCRNRNIPLAFIILPTAAAVDATRSDGVLTSSDQADPRLVLVQAHKTLDELGFQVVDPTSTLAQYESTALYFRFDGHFTPLANKIVAQVLTNEIPALQ